LRLTSAGHATRTALSPWRLGAEDREMQAELLGGIAAAAAEIAPGDGLLVEDWAAFRQQSIGRGGMTVGHVDLLSIPPPH
jgi:hypothetical protein